jgi:hypothetical protein
MYFFCACVMWRFCDGQVPHWRSLTWHLNKILKPKKKHSLKCIGLSCPTRLVFYVKCVSDLIYLYVIGCRYGNMWLHDIVQCTLCLISTFSVIFLYLYKFLKHIKWKFTVDSKFS